MMWEIMIFDVENKQDNYQFMARSVDKNELVIGYVAIEKPWYSQKCDWNYYILRNKYGGGYCGGAMSLGFEKILVDSNTIEIFNQTAKIKWNQERNISTKLVDKYVLNDEDQKKIAFIDINDKIPFELWNE